MIILSKGVPFTATEIAALNLNSPAGSYYQRVSIDFRALLSSSATGPSVSRCQTDRSGLKSSAVNRTLHTGTYRHTRLHTLQTTRSARYT